MPRIAVLPVDLRNKIAAGEVIERPASVVKELIENSLDADATEIRVEVLRGGKRMIRVSDNGNGMDREDSLLCFQRHATSKLRTEDDLFAIRTLGFRGEALPSIASVSRVKLTTGLQGAPIGVAIEIQGGETTGIKDSAVSGTSLEVRDLFFNTPARKKFLKADSTELFHIIDTVTKEALAHYSCGFVVSTDHQETMNLPKASGYRERILQIFGGEFLEGLREISAGDDFLTLAAFVSNTHAFRNRKTHQFIFVNNRPIKDQMISHALYRAYEGILPQGEHPVFFLFLGIDPGRADFNVHPTKREIRFADKELIYQFLHNAVAPVLQAERKGLGSSFTQPDPAGDPCQIASGEHRPLYPQSSQQGYSVAELQELPYKPLPASLYLGDTFVAVSGRAGLTLLDHHAAHERVLYEKLLKGMESRSSALLFPKHVRLSHREYSVVLQNKEILRSFGLDIDDFGKDTVVVRAVPDDLDGADLSGLLSDTAAGLLEEIPSGRSYKEHIAAKIACHSSIRGRGILTQEELSGLLEDLEKTDHPDQCPHGRPTRIFISLNDLNRMFKRK